MTDRYTRYSTYRSPEISIARGPSAIAVPASTFNESFTHWWYAEKVGTDLNLYRDDIGSYSLVSTVTIPFNATNISLAFDQLRRDVISFNDGGDLYIRQFDGTNYVLRGPFPGISPISFFDGLVIQEIAGSDIHLIYLSANRSTILYRTQSDLYAIERTLFTTSSPISLDAYETRIGSFKLYATRISDGQQLEYVSHPYPVDYEDEMVGDYTISEISVILTSAVGTGEDEMVGAYTVAEISILDTTPPTAASEDEMVGAYTISEIAIIDSASTSDEDEMVGAYTINQINIDAIAIPTEDEDEMIGAYTINQINIDSTV